ncbi:hypothetical protein CALCODRAFT_348403 [Calocera cornea HHB12733]|uniref:Uncharacterized protein n=1 Tax=Calocera cornea HHB12733 TaxID=1353952 RepID=A0A165JD61_9BASI|nr:hypothetical protein CALCODRAFT_348403 [Calocera cornea HHB12733]
MTPHHHQHIAPATPDLSSPHEHRDPRKLYPSALALGRPTPLHRRGTSSKYESLEDLLLEHGYKDVRVVTPLTERDRQRQASGAKERKASLASLLVGSGAQRRGAGVVLDPHGPGQQTTAVDLLRSLVSGFPLPEPSPAPAPTPHLAPPPSPLPRGRARQAAPLSPTPQRAPKPLTFLTTDPYARTPSRPGKLNHARSTPHLRRPLTPLTNRSDGSGASRSAHSSRPGTPALSTPQVARPVITPTRVQCRSHSHSHSRRRARTPNPNPSSTPGPPSPSSPLSPLLLAPSPPPSPTPARHTQSRRLKPPQTSPLPALAPAPGPARQRSIRALRAHLASAAAAREQLRASRGGSESPEPDFSDPGMLREGSLLDGEGEAALGVEGEEGELLWKGSRRDGTPYFGPLEKQGRKTALPWAWK